MLDVHPPHHPTHTWKDFFIHVATICVGLLIAVGLEQTVEYLHHRHLASEARELLKDERDSNKDSNNFNIFATQRHQLHLRRDLAILHAIRNHKPIPPGPFIVRHVRFLYLEEEWQRIHESGTISYLPEDLEPVIYRYENQDAFMARDDRSIEDLYRAASVLRGEHDPLPTTYDDNVATSNFLQSILESNETLDDGTIEHKFAGWAEPGNPARLSPAQIDALERALQVALADDDALLTYCFNIKRQLDRSPAK